MRSRAAGHSRCPAMLGQEYRGLEDFTLKGISINPHGSKLTMAESVYKVIELVGTSKESWEKAAVAAVNRAGKTLRDLRVAEVGRLDLQLKNGKVEAFRARVSVSFKYEGGT